MNVEVKETYQLEYCSSNNWAKNEDGNYVDSIEHLESNSMFKDFDTEKKAINFVKERVDELDLFYSRINRVFIKKMPLEYEVDESYDPIFIEDIVENLPQVEIF